MLSLGGHFYYVSPLIWFTVIASWEYLDVAWYIVCLSYSLDRQYIDEPLIFKCLFITIFNRNINMENELEALKCLVIS